MEKFFVCVPTYNEIDNIELLLRKIHKASLKISDFEIEIIVIDDNSPDGTAELIEKIKLDFPLKIHLIKNPGKGGLGKAYLQAFKYGIEKGAYALCEMDADLSHDPKYLIKITKLITKYDIVIASRYVENGGVINWGFKRQFLSKFGNIYSKVILGLKVNDLTGGYNCYRASVFEKVDMNSIKSLGYAFQIELKYKTIRAGFSFVETPIIFVDRVKGVSKLSNSIVSEALLAPWKLRFGKNN
jgi:dolichol-phosphate mannosyltransferase